MSSSRSGREPGRARTSCSGAHKKAPSGRIRKGLFVPVVGRPGLLLGRGLLAGSGDVLGRLLGGSGLGLGLRGGSRLSLGLASSLGFRLLTLGADAGALFAGLRLALGLGLGFLLGALLGKLLHAALALGL